MSTETFPSIIQPPVAESLSGCQRALEILFANERLLQNRLNDMHYDRVGKLQQRIVSLETELEKNKADYDCVLSSHAAKLALKEDELVEMKRLCCMLQDEAARHKALAEAAMANLGKVSQDYRTLIGNQEKAIERLTSKLRAIKEEVNG